MERALRSTVHWPVSAGVRLLLIGTDVDVAALRTRSASKIERADDAPEIDAFVDRGRGGLDMQIRRHRVQEHRIRILRMVVESGGRLESCKSRMVSVVPQEIRRGRTSGEEIKVVVDIGWSRRAVGVIVDEQALRGRIHDIVLEHVVGGVVLDLKLPAAGALGVILEQRVVDDRRITCSSPVIRSMSD